MAKSSFYKDSRYNQMFLKTPDLFKHANYHLVDLRESFNADGLEDYEKLSIGSRSSEME
jgi:hypothetical protein